MPMPHTYRHASREWRAILDDARDQMDLSSDNMTYTAIQAVLLAFRARLTLEQALRFADILPAVLRAIFVHGLRADHRPRPLPDRAALIAEIRRHRRDHNLTPDTAIDATAFALRRSVNARDLNRFMASLPDALADFWALACVADKDLEMRIV